MQYSDVYNDSNSYYIKSASKILSTMGFGESKGKEGHSDKEKERYKPRKKVKNYLWTLAKATETSNEKLEQRRMPFRFYVYQEGERVLIDFIQLDRQGNVKTTNTKDITNEDFNMWIDDIANIEGLVIDTIG